MAELEKIAITALKEAHRVHNQLGPQGREKVVTNQFGDTSLRADLEAEKIIVEKIKENF